MHYILVQKDAYYGQMLSKKKSSMMPFSLMTDCICKLELNLALSVCVAAEVRSRKYHLQKGSQRAAAAGMMVAAKCQQTQLWSRFAKTAAPCDDTDSALNAQWHGKQLLVASRLHQLTPLIAVLPLLCVVTPAVVYLLFRKSHRQSGSIIREEQQHTWDKGCVSCYEHVCVCLLHTQAPSYLISWA